MTRRRRWLPSPRSRFCSVRLEPDQCRVWLQPDQGRADTRVDQAVCLRWRSARVRSGSLSADQGRRRHDTAVGCGVPDRASEGRVVVGHRRRARRRVGRRPAAPCSSGSCCPMGRNAASRFARSLNAQLTASGYSPAQVTHLALSHYHWDHTANANAFARATWLVRQSRARRDVRRQAAAARRRR